MSDIASSVLHSCNYDRNVSIVEDIDHVHIVKSLCIYKGGLVYQIQIHSLHVDVQLGNQEESHWAYGMKAELVRDRYGKFEDASVSGTRDR